MADRKCRSQSACFTRWATAAPPPGSSPVDHLPLLLSLLDPELGPNGPSVLLWNCIFYRLLPPSGLRAKLSVSTCRGLVLSHSWIITPRTSGPVNPTPATFLNSQKEKPPLSFKSDTSLTRWFVRLEENWRRAFSTHTVVVLVIKVVSSTIKYCKYLQKSPWLNKPNCCCSCWKDGKKPSVPHMLKPWTSQPGRKSRWW